MAETLLASAARTASGTAVLTADYGLILSAQFLLDVTAAATEVDDTLDVYIQHSIDGGTTYDDFVHFTQVLGNGGAVKELATWVRDVVAEDELRTPADASIAAGVLHGPAGGKWRIKWVIVDSGTDNASFTFSLSAQLNRR